ncbi:multifunctional fatty acid oxidation complex subunit alpha [Endozoicomonas montiporae]|uniref:enoyl-CoA hydratase n=2 Tax=Endozoicomonas montiporae TaxID=1027273 RepID=A0A081NAW1_9GAMM|nr:fatty acid oxidation complex subunit alpha FadB [Endozoicomonas montiporae]AMO56720.1 Fatty acid oxidation complex subunit alpha [Endozoicomonas montiporae CL-33]KEQ15584.1 multifunctional fatty acid oxidation complex subunit alpha [Endozoicomonas montiporae]
MIYQGKAFKVLEYSEGIAELRFDLEGESVNKFNQLALEDLGEALTAIEQTPSIKGLILSSGKNVFVVGADITEFVANFRLDDETLFGLVMDVNQLFNRLEDLDIPTVAAINGTALGGGFEVSLATDYRVLSTKGSVGLPEVKLGIFPGWGGTVRLPRVTGADNAIEWICTGKTWKPEDAIKIGAVDAVVEPEKLMESAATLLQRCIAGELDYRGRKQEKRDPLKLPPMESMMVFETAKSFIAQKAGPHMPAPVTAVKTIQKHATLPRDKALEAEAKNFVKMAKTPVAEALVGLFLSDQFLKKQAKEWIQQSGPVEKAAVLGAGIMGGGIAYQSALKKTPILMKDINQQGIDLGLKEAGKLLSKRVSKGRLDSAGMGEVLNRIVPTLSYGDFAGVDLVVEAVLEKESVKKAVLAEVEGQVREDAVLSSNTSTISITELAKALKRPENFCGMHFFNPVHMMPLVEVIRGEKTSDKTVATVVNYARKMGKTPIVVNDCPGFMVNRVLFPYFGGFTQLVQDGADFRKIDKVMERFGMPMGPAYLLDVVGIDTAEHAQKVMEDGYPDRMKTDVKTALNVMFEQERFGQKNGKGFYIYEPDKRGKPKKQVDEKVFELLKEVAAEPKEFSDEEIIARMMIPLGLETVRTLEEGIVQSAIEADMALVMGIGFPVFRGGILKYIDAMGVSEFVTLADQYAYLGPLYQATDGLRQMAEDGKRFYHA